LKFLTSKKCRNIYRNSACHSSKKRVLVRVFWHFPNQENGVLTVLHLVFSANINVNQKGKNEKQTRSFILLWRHTLKYICHLNRNTSWKLSTAVWRKHCRSDVFITSFVFKIKTKHRARNNEQSNEVQYTQTMTYTSSLVITICNYSNFNYSTEWGNEGIAPPIFDLDTTRTWVASFMPSPSYLLEKMPLYLLVGWVNGLLAEPVWMLYLEEI
jgi:hypothetical protein